MGSESSKPKSSSKSGKSKTSSTTKKVKGEEIVGFEKVAIPEEGDEKAPAADDVKIHAGGVTALEALPEDEAKDLGFAVSKKLTVEDFTFLKVVGKGSFGKVMQVRKKDTGEIFAMKVLKKKALVKRKQVTHTITERKTLACIEHPFIVSLRFSFQTDAKLYMILDFFNGGELFFHLKKDGRFTEKRSKYYGGEIMLALGHIHSKGVIYRDLKPENILLDCDGHIKITDFGLSKDSLKGDMITHTFCGTPEYLAPEVLQQVGHGKAVDWWSFGTLLYEMMTGLPPFYNQNLNVMYERILHAPIPLPKYLSKDARSVFLGLLERDPKRRLGSGPADAEEIQSHAFFKSIDFDKMVKKELKVPYKPKVADEMDTSHIEEEFTSETPKDTPVMKTGSMIAAKDMFEGFTYDERAAM
jgi:serine/threonine protein kinase